MLTLLVTCGSCESTREARRAAKALGLDFKTEVITRSDDRTCKASSLGFKLPVLVDEDGNVSKDGVIWSGRKARKHVTHPVGEVYVDNNHA